MRSRAPARPLAAITARARTPAARAARARLLERFAGAGLALALVASGSGCSSPLALLAYAATSERCVGCGGARPTVPAWDDLKHAPNRVDADEQTMRDEARADLASLDGEEFRYDDAELERYLDGIVERLAPRRAEAAPALRVVVYRLPEANAGALPDGTILFALTLLAAYENEAELAFVLAHEIVHLLKRHALIQARYDATTESHVRRMNLSRELETEADRTAVELIAAAGYDARQALPALGITGFTSNGAPAQIRSWNSHSLPREREKELARAIADVPTPGTEVGVEPFQQQLDRVRLDAAQIELEAGRLEFARARVEEQLARHPDESAAYVLRARITAERDPAARRSKAVGDDLERAVANGPNDPAALRALGLFLRDTGERERSREMLRRYLAADPEAFDRKLIERYVVEPTAL